MFWPLQDLDCPHRACGHSIWADGSSLWFVLRVTQLAFLMEEFVTSIPGETA